MLLICDCFFFFFVFFHRNGKVSIANELHTPAEAPERTYLSKSSLVLDLWTFWVAGGCVVECLQYSMYK